MVGSLVAGLVAAAVAVGMSTLVLLREVRRAVRRGRIAGCRWESRSGLLTALAVRSFEAVRLAPCSKMHRCRRWMEGRLAVLGFVECAVHQAGP